MSTHNPQHPSPIYLRPAADPSVLLYKDALQLVAAQQKGLSLGHVDIASIKEGHVSMAQDVVIAAQHYPEALAALIFGIDFTFCRLPGDEAPMPEAAWKGQPDIARWFYKMGSLPNIIFFLADHDTRFYALAGDMLAANEAEVAVIPGEKQQEITFNGTQVKTLAGRLHQAGYFMHLYCHGTGVDPQPYIVALLAEYDFPGVTYEGIRRQYESDIHSGIQLRVGK